MANSWNPALNDLIEVLARTYITPERARRVVLTAGLNPAWIDFSGGSIDVWLRVVEEAHARKMIHELLRTLKQDYPSMDIDSLAILMTDRSAREPEGLDPAPTSTDGSDSFTFEKVTGTQATFLPIAFLELGVIRARSVALVDSPLGLATGFLILNNLLVTNNHVIPTATAAKETKVFFNYQKALSGTYGKREEVTLRPELGFASSPVEQDDWTAVRVSGDANTTWGALELSRRRVSVGDFVNIIQHPGGQEKQIALYHNAVAHVGEKHLQYLTDTMRGSSGSPVFNGEWEVVALHQGARWLPEPGSAKLYFRNQGISAIRLLRGLQEQRVI